MCFVSGVKVEFRVIIVLLIEVILWECCSDFGGGVGGLSWLERGILLRLSCVCGYLVFTV